MICIGHRGAMGHEPENTLRSIRKALALGVDAVEIDVYSLEGRLIVIHDRDLARTTNGTGDLKQRSFDYVRSLDAGKGEQVPTLEEVIDTVERQATVNIELKGNHTAQLVAQLIQAYLEQGWSTTDFIVSSFNHYQLQQFKILCPEIEIGSLIYGLPWKYLSAAQELAAATVIFGLDYVTLEQVEIVHQANLSAWVYTVNEPDDLDLMRAMQVDGIFTNYPERVKANN